ncbi:MAG: helix-turn-helix domain-containing protein [Desulfobacterales bacterium]
MHGPNGAAALLGINPSTLRHRLRKLGITHERIKN